jgi:hypothetical protein
MRLGKETNSSKVPENGEEREFGTPRFISRFHDVRGTGRNGADKVQEDRVENRIIVNEKRQSQHQQMFQHLNHHSIIR